VYTANSKKVVLCKPKHAKFNGRINFKLSIQFNLLNCHKKGIIYKTNIMKNTCDEEAEVEFIRLI
jgi:hypothetical protein